MSFEQALAELGQHIQLEIPPERTGKSIQLRLESNARIGIAPHTHYVRVHLSHPVAAYDASRMLLAAMKQSSRLSTPFTLQSGWLEHNGQGWLVQAIQIPVDQVNAIQLRQAIDALQEQFAQLQAF